MDKEHELESDESDEDYCPDGAENEALSECDSDSSISDLEEPKKAAHKKRKRNKSPECPKKTSDLGPQENASSNIDEEEEKRRADALWSQFLSDVPEEHVRPPNKKDTHSTRVASPKSEIKSKPATNTIDKVRIKEIFDFAGEKVEVMKEVSLDETDKPSSSSSKKISAMASKVPPQLKRPSTGGLSSVLGQLNKKNKLNVLEKTKLDWDTFKDREGLSEELKTHNKGKDGYLERQDFLERSDLRQFELERDMRHKARRGKP